MGCTEAMIDMEDESCDNQIGSPGGESLEVGCCLSTCDVCVAPDCKCCTCNQQCAGQVQCPSACLEPRNIATTGSCPCQCGEPCPSGYNPYCDTGANPGAVCSSGTPWCPKSCKQLRSGQDQTGEANPVNCPSCCPSPCPAGQSCDLGACDG